MGLEQRGSDPRIKMAAVEERFDYRSLWAIPAKLIRDPRTGELIKIPGELKEELKPYVHRSPNEEVFVVVEAQEVYEEDSATMEEMKDLLVNGKTKGIPHCCYLKAVELDGMKFTDSCSRPTAMMIGLDIPYSARYQKSACGEEHALKIMGAITDNLNKRSVDNTVIEEYEDWDYDYPPIFVVAKKEELIG